jgi:Holliday junction resolvase RusA-like endonuclease
MNKVRFVVVGVPKGKERPRVIRLKDGRPHTYTPTGTKQREDTIANAYKQEANGIYFNEKPIKISMEFYYPIPTSWTKREKESARAGRRNPCVKPDLDNACKLVMDALNGVAFGDDKQVLYMSASKRYGDVARTEVTIEEVEV